MERVEGHTPGTAFYVYILRCSDGRFYVASASDVGERIAAHNAGRAAVYTALRRPVKLVYSEVQTSRRVAVDRERQIKGWSRAKKEALIAGDIGTVKELARRKR
jgi:predicted GIY-YIG superfamily endonuclease